MIDFYTWDTPNGHKVHIMLEACELPYAIHLVDITKNQQFSDHFLRLNPNNKIPVIVDSQGPKQAPITLFETGAILIYLAQKTGKFLPDEPSKYWQVMQWLMWQMGGFGPMLGQAHHFNRFAPEKVPYAIKRYQLEAERLWGVLEEQLTDRDFVCDTLSIADFAIFPWAKRYQYQNIHLQNYPKINAYLKRMRSFPFVEKGLSL